MSGGQWLIQYVGDCRDESEAREALEFLSSFEDVPVAGAYDGFLPDGCRRVLVLPSLAWTLGIKKDT